MKTLIPLVRFLLLCLAASAATVAVRAQAPDGAIVDYGDSTSQTLVGKAQSALGGGQPDVAVLYADRCIELYGAEALKQQQALTAEPKEKDAVFKNWALNDVGYCHLIKGQALEKLGRRDDAIKTYLVLTQKLNYAKIWDPQGWFWPPAAVAQERVKTLEFSTL